MLDLAVSLDTIRLKLGMCSPTRKPADGVARLLKHLARSVSTLLLEKSTGAAALRAGVLAHLEAAEAAGVDAGCALSRVGDRLEPDEDRGIGQQKWANSSGSISRNSGSIGPWLRQRAGWRRA